MANAGGLRVLIRLAQEPAPTARRSADAAPLEPLAITAVAPSPMCTLTASARAESGALARCQLGLVGGELPMSPLNPSGVRSCRASRRAPQSRASSSRSQNDAVPGVLRVLATQTSAFRGVPGEVG